MAILDRIKEAVSQEKKPVNDSYSDRSDRVSPEEQKKLATMILQDIEASEKVQQSYIARKKVDLQHKMSERPSLIEGMTKKSWQSDRNLGVAAATGDAYQATLFATCWNPDSIHFIATEENDVDNKDNLEKFTKAIIGRSHANVTPEVDDYVANKVDQGFSMFEVYRSVTYDWVDRQIPRYNRKGDVVGYDTKTEKIRIEKGVMENIDNLDDLLMPRYGDEVQSLPYIIRVIHLTGDKILQCGKSGQFFNVDAKFVSKCKLVAKNESNMLEKVKADYLGLEDVVDSEFRNLPIDIYKWYGWYELGGRYEKFRVHYERTTGTILSIKPIRKITKNGKFPFVGGPFDRVAGQLRGMSLYQLIEDPVNALNETWNQKSDFQYVTNCPFGFHKATEGYTKNVYDLEPGVSYPTEGNPREDAWFPNLSRSMAWAESDIRILFEVIEKRTGAASYFASTERNTSGTATRDMIVARNSETRFGKWVTRIQGEIAEALTMLVNVYQEHMPDNLGQRILGEDGKGLFKNLSPETIRYNADARLEPDTIAGSKAYERQVMLWAFGALQQSVWFDPRINPKGNWLLTCRVMKSQGIAAPEAYLPPEPKAEIGTGKDVDNVWTRLMQGEVVDVEESWNIPQILAGLYKKKADSYFDLDEEYRPTLDMLIFKLEVAYQEFVRKAMEEQMANQIAQRAISMGQGMPMGMPGNSAGMPPGGTNMGQAGGNAIEQGIPQGGGYM